MDDFKALRESGAVPIVFCDQKKVWLPIEGHIDCENCAGPVFDENDDPVSFICTRRGETRAIQPEHEHQGEEGRGAPSDPDAHK